MSRKRSYLSAIGLLLIVGCLVDSWQHDGHTHGSQRSGEEVAVIQDWYKHAMLAERFSEGYRAPVVARLYAYLGIAGFHTVMSGRVTGEYAAMVSDALLPSVPIETLHLPSALNACYAALSQHFFLMTTVDIEHDRAATHQKWYQLFEQSYDADLIRRSVMWGKDVADAIFAWAATDSLGHHAEFHNYDKDYIMPDAPGRWKPSTKTPMPPLLPHWGGVRTFSASVHEVPLTASIPYSESQGSTYYTQAYELYAMSAPLSQENKWIAEFWSDDHPGLTLTPAGRWISIAHQVIAQANPPVAVVMETYLKTGIALSDATVTCWQGKYTTASERPETYIQKMIDPAWLPFLDSPPFPAYPSGHSALGAAATEVLSQLYGPNFKLTDRTHEGRREFRGEPRTFHTFRDMARENAFSRLALGVHFRADCEEGLRLGRLIGRRIAEIPVSDLPPDDLSMSFR